MLSISYSEIAKNRKSIAYTGSAKAVGAQRYSYSEKEKPMVIQLAFNTLATFNLQASPAIIEFVRETAVSFLDDDDPYAPSENSC